MARLKRWAVTVEWTEKRTLFVAARRAGGAEAVVLSEEGWQEAVRYDEDMPWTPPKTMKVVDTKVVE